MSSRGLSPFGTNLRIGGVEIDILAKDHAGSVVIVEVRGRMNERYRPSRFISERKKRRLLFAASVLKRDCACKVRVELLEILGEPGLTAKQFWYRIA